MFYLLMKMGKFNRDLNYKRRQYGLKLEQFAKSSNRNSRITNLTWNIF